MLGSNENVFGGGIEETDRISMNDRRKDSIQAGLVEIQD